VHVFQGYLQKGLFSFTYGKVDSLVEFLHVDNLVEAHLLAGEALNGPNAVAVSCYILFYFKYPYLTLKLSSSSLTFNVTRTQSAKNHTLFTVHRQFGCSTVVKTSSGFMEVMFISIGWMRFLAPSLENAVLLFVLVMTPGLYLHNVEVADRDPARRPSVYKQTGLMYFELFCSQLLKLV